MVLEMKLERECHLFSSFTIFPLLTSNRSEILFSDFSNRPFAGELDLCQH